MAQAQDSNVLVDPEPFDFERLPGRFPGARCVAFAALLEG